MNKDNKKINLNIIILIPFLIIFIFYSFYFGYKVVNYFIESNKNKELIVEISNYYVEKKNIDSNENTTNIEENNNNKNENNTNELYSVDFEKLKKINPDVVAFIKVNGTNIENAVVKGNDNSYYLKHNIKKEESRAGWLFIDYRNKLDGTDKNIVIYGHNMKDGTMFGQLKKSLKPDWFLNEGNKYIYYTTENGTTIYKIFSVYEIKNENYYRKINFKDGEYNNFIETIKNRSKYNFDSDISSNDNILTLTTCSSNSDYRIVIHAKKY